MFPNLHRFPHSPFPSYESRWYLPLTWHLFGLTHFLLHPLSYLTHPPFPSLYSLNAFPHSIPTHSFLVSTVVLIGNSIAHRIPLSPQCIYRLFPSLEPNFIVCQHLLYALTQYRVPKPDLPSLSNGERWLLSQLSSLTIYIFLSPLPIVLLKPECLQSKGFPIISENFMTFFHSNGFFC